MTNTPDREQRERVAAWIETAGWPTIAQGVRNGKNATMMTDDVIAMLADTELSRSGVRGAMLHVCASLAAAISLLEKGGKAAKKAAPSDTMFDQMLADYRTALERARAGLAETELRQ